MQFRPGPAHLPAHIVSGRHRLGAQIPRDIQQVAELHRLIAADAGNGGFAAQIGVREVFDHLLTEPALVVEHIVRDAHRLGRGACVVDILAGAAGALLLDRRAVIIELQRHAHDIVAGAGQQGRSHRGIDAAGHGRDDPRADRQAHSVAHSLHQAVAQGV